MRYDALLLLSFGGPEGPDDVMPFLENVTRGRGVPRARLEAVAEHYHHFGGVSPINAQCRALKAAIELALDEAGESVPVYWGNRNWHPFVEATVEQMARDGVRRAAAFVTSAYRGYSCCRQYLEDIERATARVPGAPVIEKLPIYYSRPGFIDPMVDNTRAALGRLQAGARVVFTAHSVPMGQPGRESYVADLRDASSRVAAGVGVTDWELVFQSRSGPPSVPWLEPDVGAHLEKLHGDGVEAVALVPIGFVSAHMEVAYDLDVECAELAARLGMSVARADTADTDPRFAAMAVDLLAEEPTPCGGGCCRS